MKTGKTAWRKDGDNLEMGLRQPEDMVKRPVYGAETAWRKGGDSLKIWWRQPVERVKTA